MRPKLLIVLRAVAPLEAVAPAARVLLHLLRDAGSDVIARLQAVDARVERVGRDRHAGGPVLLAKLGAAPAAAQRGLLPPSQRMCVGRRALLLPSLPSPSCPHPWPPREAMRARGWEEEQEHGQEHEGTGTGTDLIDEDWYKTFYGKGYYKIFTTSASSVRLLMASSPLCFWNI